MEHDCQFKVSQQIMSVAQIATGSALSTSVAKLFDNGKVGPENKIKNAKS